MLLLSWLVPAAYASAAIPQGYYDKLEGLTGEALKNAAFRTVNPHTEISSYSDLPKYFERTDVYPNSQRWWDMYSDIPLYAPSFKGLNREHSFPKSWWGGLTDVPAYVDLNHLYPSEAAANQAKSNNPLGTVYKATFDNGISRVGTPVDGQGGGAPKVFEPDDEYKGDFARTYFYMATCYQNMTWKYTFMVQNNTYPTLNAWAVELLLQWSRQDPVSQKEVDRNEVVYGIQNNRNPFIDFPELAEYIWGLRKGEAFHVPEAPDVPSGEPSIITPTNEMTLDFGDVAIGGKTTAKLFFHTQNFTSDINLTVSGADRAWFAPTDRRVSHSLTNGSEGYWLTIAYEPKALGEHQASLVVYGDDITGSFTVAMRGACKEVPALTAPTAFAASNVTDDSYTASWDAHGEVVDWYVVTRTRYIGSTPVIVEEQVDAEESSVTFDDFSASDRESYAVQSVRLGYRSPMSNIVYVEHSGIEALEGDLPLSVRVYEGVVVFYCGDTQRGVRIHDAAGRLVRLLDKVDNLDEIHLPLGVYFLTTSAHRTPVKVLAR